MANGNTPAAKFKLGYVSATIWHNDNKYFNVVVSRSYKDGNEYKETDQLGSGDVMNAVKVLETAAEWILAQ